MVKTPMAGVNVSLEATSATLVPIVPAETGVAAQAVPKTAATGASHRLVEAIDQAAAGAATPPATACPTSIQTAVGAVALIEVGPIAAAGIADLTAAKALPPTPIPVGAGVVAETAR